MINTILLDFDGTLSPSLDLWLKAYQDGLAAHNRSIPEEEIIRNWFYEKYENLCAQYDLPSAQILEENIRLSLLKSYETAQLFPMVREFLEESKRKGLKLGIVSSSYREQLKEQLKRLEIAEYFDTLVGAGDTPYYKPRPEPVNLALENLDSLPHETLFVGDYLVDVEAGKAAGTFTALYMPEQNARFYDFEMLRASAPDFIFSHYEEMVVYLEGLK
jgi:pyrophosphatase PpaX